MFDTLKVLIVDDSEPSRFRLKQKLGVLNVEIVAEAANGLEALDEFSRTRPDLVFLDIMMPEMDGIECFMKLKQQNDSPHCIFVSSLAEEPQFLEAYRETMSEELFLPKSCTVEELEQKIKNLFKGEVNISSGSAG